MEAQPAFLTVQHIPLPHSPTHRTNLRSFEDLDFFFKSAAEDPHLAEMAQSGGGNVFVTDTVLAHLMACTRSANPWDIVITVLPGGVIFLGACEGAAGLAGGRSMRCMGSAPGVECGECNA